MLINIKKWLDDNRELLKPPINNKNLYIDSEDYIVMIVGGPNSRKDFHYNNTEELFYQLEGDIEVIIQEDNERKVIKMGPGDMYLLPAKTPHCPIRKENSIGLVIEKKRIGNIDGLLWFCDICNNKLHEVYFELVNIETDFIPHFDEFYKSEDKRTCKCCGNILFIQ